MPAKKQVLFLTSVFLVTASAAVAIRSQNTASQPPTQQVVDAGVDVPVADFAAPEPSDPDKRAKRQARGRRHNLRDKNLSPEDVARFALRDGDSHPVPATSNKPRPAQQPAPGGGKHEYSPPVVGAAVTEESPPEQALPTHISNAVVIGEVTDAKAYLSEDRTSVYSEFTIRVGEVLKNGGESPLMPGASVTALRPGGGVRFPSGKVRKFLVDGRTLPRAGGRYALFLKYDDLAHSFYIVTGYELRGGKVFPLDGLPQGATENHPFASYGKYLNADEASFLNDVRQAIINPPRQHRDHRVYRRDGLGRRSLSKARPDLPGRLEKG